MDVHRVAVKLIAGLERLHAQRSSGHLFPSQLLDRLAGLGFHGHLDKPVALRGTLLSVTTHRRRLHCPVWLEELAEFLTYEEAPKTGIA